MWLGLMWSLAPSSRGRVAATHPASRRAPGPTRDGTVLDTSRAPPVPADVAAELALWGQAEVGAAGSGVHHHPSQQKARLGWGLAALALPVLGGQHPWLLTRHGAKQGPRAVLVRVSPPAGTEGWVPAGPPASLAAGRQGYPTASPAASSLCASSSQLKHHSMGLLP